jgi:hypothetical protein
MLTTLIFIFMVGIPTGFVSIGSQDTHQFSLQKLQRLLKMRIQILMNRTFPVSPGAGCNVTEDGEPGGS